ncbi:MAG: putative transaldolase [Parcubacteria group bacterium GW2011_GWA1_47_11]|nr:MAG: putative transaldolase [Parcubacteria group bacterium GW2011_GWA1_47_11]
MKPDRTPISFFLDTASLADIAYWKEFGVVEGVTTNPALLAKEGGDPLQQLKAVAALVDGPVSAEVTCTDAADMIRQGLGLSALAPNIVIKLPALPQGYFAARELKRRGIKLNITLTFQPAQAIPFLKLNPDFVSLIVGRVEDFGLDSVPLIKEMRDTIDSLGSTTKLLTASIRNPSHLTAAVNGGSHAVTVPPSTWKLILSNPLSVRGEQDFMESWKSLDGHLRKGYETIGE